MQVSRSLQLPVVSNHKRVREKRRVDGTLRLVVSCTFKQEHHLFMAPHGSPLRLVPPRQLLHVLCRSA